jgi:hypothetical protein
VQESILLLYVSAASSRGELGKSAPFPSTSCLTSEIAPGDLDSVPPDNMSDVSVPSMSALTVQVRVRGACKVRDVACKAELTCMPTAGGYLTSGAHHQQQQQKQKQKQQRVNGCLIS